MSRRLHREGTRAARHALLARTRSSSPTAAASTAPTWPTSPAARSATAPSPSPPTARAIPNATASWPSRSRDDFGLRHEIIQTSELERPEYRANPANRCYYCKHELYTHLSRIAAELRHAIVVDGNNADDRGDYRPGRQAAREFGVRSPLDEVDLTKDEIRELSRRAGLPTWDEPASACLSSRIPYHTRSDRREAADDRARRSRRCARSASACSASATTTIWRGSRSRATRCRARSSPTIAAAIVRELKAVGYRYVSLDLQGYRMGSLNEGLFLRPA